MFRSSETKIKLNIKEVILIFYVYIGYLAAVNIAAFLAYILDFDFKRDAVKKGDEAGAAVFSAAGGAPAIIFMSLTYRNIYCGVCFASSDKLRFIFRFF